MEVFVPATKKSCISLFDFFIYVVYNITCNCFTKNKF